jgi:hypothetical protein
MTSVRAWLSCAHIHVLGVFMKYAATILVAAGLASLLSAFAAFADDAALKALDTDKDGTVSLAEAQAGASKVFATLNTDKDATLSTKELGDRIDAASLKAADPDNDGALSAHMCPRALLNDPSKCEVAREEWDAGPTKHTPEDFASSVRERGPN